MTFARRRFLAGLGLGTASPLLTSIASQLTGEAMAQPAQQQPTAKFKRLIVFTGSNGMLERFTTCRTRGERDFDLGPIYQPVAAYKDRMTIAHRFFIPHSKDLHGSQTSTLTVVPCTNPGA